MPNVDALTRAYLDRNDRFAELFNTFVFNGRHVAAQNRLQDESPIQELFFPSTQKTVKKERDILKPLKLVTDGKLNYLLLGVENQLSIHYAMPVRTMVYDALHYGKQIQKRTGKNKRKGSSGNGSEYISGFRKNQKLIPIITLVINWGEKKWDGPLSLKEMFDESFLNAYGEYVQDYKLNLLDLNDVSDEVMDTLKTDLKKVLYFRKYSRNQDMMEKLLKAENSMYRCVYKDAAYLMRELTHANFEIPEEGETMDMCEAIEAMTRKEVNAVRKEVETLARKEIASVRKEAAKAQKKEAEAEKKAEEAEKELAEFRTESLRIAFNMMSQYNRDLSLDEIFRIIAENYKTTIDEVRRILLS